MPVSKGRKRKPPKLEPASTKPTPPAKRMWTPARQLMAIVLGAATLIGGISAVLFFWPRMTVTPSGLFDDSNAYSETFIVANTGFLAFEDMQVGIGICSIDTAKHDFGVTPNNCEGDSAHILIGGPSWEAAELRRDEPFSIVLSDGLNVATEKYRAEHPNVISGFQMMSDLKAANVIVVVTFKPWPAWWKIHRSFRFVAEEQSNSKMMWRAVPLSWQKIELLSESSQSGVPFPGAFLCGGLSDCPDTCDILITASPA
jgi:hypothetical protein